MTMCPCLEWSESRLLQCRQNVKEIFHAVSLAALSWLPVSVLCCFASYCLRSVTGIWQVLINLKIWCEFQARELEKLISTVFVTCCQKAFTLFDEISFTKIVHSSFRCRLKKENLLIG